MSTALLEEPKVKTCDVPTAFPITVTEKAASEVKRIIADQQASGAADTLYLRISVRGGGCSGFQNKLDLDTAYNEKTDVRSEQNGVVLVVDKKSMLYLQGATVDFHEDLNARGFRITNPQAKGSCGCGSSYTM
jgi:iron-sulfur cluster assembly accessory protein